MEWNNLAHGEEKMTSSCEYGGEPLGSNNFLTTCGSSPQFSAAELCCMESVSWPICVEMNVWHGSAAAAWHRDKQRLNLQFVVKENNNMMS